MLKKIARTDRFASLTTSLLTRLCLAFILAAVITTLYGGMAQAATSDSLEDLYNLLKDWTTGYLGKLLALTALAVGVGSAVTGHFTYSLVAFAIAGMLAFGPGIIEDIFASK